ncbi:FUSC family protein [Nonomuraea angiospora]|uniref:FUSC family protein n=1 Tax=Nonomuraea angiospora TaxID=46172 RepID=UPI003326E909
MGIQLRRAWDRLAVRDPGLMRSTTALAAVAGIALALAVLAFLDMPAPFLVAGCFAPFTAALAIGDGSARDQVFVVAAAVPLVFAVLPAGGALAPFPVMAEGVFVVLIFWAVYIRRYGPRGQALGIFAFMAYFLTQFLDARVSDLPGLYAAVGVGFAAHALVRFGLLRTGPARTLRRLRRAFHTHLGHVVLGAIEVVRAGRDDARLARSLERRVARLHRDALLIADLLDQDVAAQSWESSANRGLRRVAQAEVAAQRLAVLIVRSASAGPACSRAREHLVAELQVVHGHLMRPRDMDHDRVDRQLGGAPVAFLDVRHAIGELTRAVAGLGLVDGAPYRLGDGTQPPRTSPRGLRRVTTRQAVQAAAAGAIAVVLGELLSSERWYWAVLTAWVVFVNTESSQEILVQGFQRLLGTVLGVVCGPALAAVGGGGVLPALCVSLVCVYGIFRTPPRAYWAVTFFVTCLIAMTFVLLGTFSAELLALRVQETVLGALCGVLMGRLVLPTTACRAGAARLLEVLRVLRRTRVREGGALFDIRELDGAIEELRGSLRPLTHPLNPRRAGRAHARHLLALLESCAYHARSLAAVTAEPAVQLGEAGCEVRAVERIRATLDRTIALVEAGGWPAIPCHDGRRTLARLAAERRWGGDRTSSAAHRELFHLERLDEATTELAGALGGARVGCPAR